MAMPSWWRNQCRQRIDQLQRAEHQGRAPIASRLGQVVDKLVRVDLREALQREGRAGTVAQQALQPGAIRAGNAHRRIQGEAAMRPAEHVAGLRGLEQSAAGEPP